MVRLTRIYTRGGDKGQTSLSDGARVPKHDRRVAAYGSVDEANAAIGMARLHLTPITATPDGPSASDRAIADAMLARIQNDLFDLGADLSTPECENPPWPPLRMIEAQTQRLEAEIDWMNEDLKPLDSFVLPGGVPAAAYLHLARTIVRRAERDATLLAAHESVGTPALAFINRLSDHLFVLSRWLNQRGVGDVLWVPGLTRPKPDGNEDGTA
jgi:cob(I)alamin adenosyltransferase